MSSGLSRLLGNGAGVITCVPAPPVWCGIRTHSYGSKCHCSAIELTIGDAFGLVTPCSEFNPVALPLSYLSTGGRPAIQATTGGQDWTRTSNHGLVGKVELPAPIYQSPKHPPSSEPQPNHLPACSTLLTTGLAAKPESAWLSLAQEDCNSLLKRSFSTKYFECLIDFAAITCSESFLQQRIPTHCCYLVVWFVNQAFTLD